MMQCLQCHTGIMVEPKDKHPSYLICDMCKAIELTYIPQPHQDEFHSSPIQVDSKTGEWLPQIFGVFGGYGSSKSRATVEEFFLRAINNPNGTGLITAPTLALLKKTTIKMLLEEVIPPPLVEYYNKSDQEIRLINGFRIYGIPSDDEEKLRSINAGLVHMEESSGISRTIYDQLLTRMRDPFVKDKAMFVCSNPEQGWLKDVLVDNEKRKNPNHPDHKDYNPYIRVLVWETKLNKYLPSNFIQINSIGKPQWWIRKYLEGSFEAADGAVYPNFSSTLVEPFNIPKDWMKVIGMDHGLRNPTAVIFGAIDPKTSTLYLYREYYVPNRLVPEHAKYLKPMFDEIPPGTLYRMVADPSISNKTDPLAGKSVQGLYQEYGIYWSKGNNQIDAGLLKVNSYIERGKLKVFNTLTNTVREHMNYKFPELSMDDDKNLDEKPVKKNEHSCFVAGTMVRTLHGSVLIEKIAIGSLVLTRQGYKPVVDWAITGENKKTYTVKFSNGKSFKATGNHPVWVKEKGFVPVDSLRYGDIIITEEEILWDILKSSSTMGIGTDGIQIRSLFPTDDITNEHMTEEQKPNTCTEGFTRTTLDRYQKGITSITRTETITTMIRQTLKHFLHSTIYQNTQKEENLTGNISQKFKRWQKNGTHPKRGMIGTVNMLTIRLLRQSQNAMQHVKCVVRNLSIKWPTIRRNFVPTTASLNGVDVVEWTTKQDNVRTAEKTLSQISTQKRSSAQEYVLSVSEDEQRQSVYNITVADAHEYFANGILVSNCDALRYLCMTLPDNPDDLNTISFSPPEKYGRMSIKEEYEEFGHDSETPWENWGY